MLNAQPDRFFGYESNKAFLMAFFLFYSQHSVEAVNAGVNPIGDTSYNFSHWDLGSAFFFAGTVITTIGIVFMVYTEKIYRS